MVGPEVEVVPGAGVGPPNEKPDDGAAGVVEEEDDGADANENPVDGAGVAVVLPPKENPPGAGAGSDFAPLFPKLNPPPDDGAGFTAAEPKLNPAMMNFYIHNPNKQLSLSSVLV